jgi:diguanylate cyclase (GGDEF)-like protein
MKKLFEWLGVQNAFEKGLIARILVILCLAFVIFGAVFVTIRIVMTLHPAFPPAHWTDLLIESFVLVMALITLWFIRSDRIRAASRVILGGILVAVTLQTYFLGGPTNDISGAMGLLLFAILAILFLDRSDRWIAVFLAITIFIVLNIMSASGYIMPSINLTPLGKTIYSIFIWLSISIIIGVILIAAMGAMRREPHLLEMQFSETTGNVPFLSAHDALTGLYNRLFIETEFSRLEKSRQFPISIITAEIQDLKKINDTQGYKAGDEMVINVARLFAGVFRPEDILSRYGGDEFAVILPSVDPSTAQVVIGRIEKQLNAYNKKHTKQPINISVGVSTAKQGDSLKAHLKLAEKMMWQEK